MAGLSSSASLPNLGSEASKKVNWAPRRSENDDVLNEIPLKNIKIAWV